MGETAALNFEHLYANTTVDIILTLMILGHQARIATTRHFLVVDDSGRAAPEEKIAMRKKKNAK